jgi:hypothetical protein
MDPVFIWLEQTALGTWVRESVSIFAFPGILVLHTIGMAFLVGSTSALCLRALGVASGIPAPSLLRFRPVAWFGFIVNSVSGALLLLAYPAKALTNPVFYLKLAAIAAAIVVVIRLGRRIRDHLSAGDEFVRGDRVLAGTTLALWALAITAGRLLAYTHSRLMAS